MTMTSQQPFAAFAHRLIDYAGLFPPAALPLDLALANYAAYQDRPQHWMLGRFVLPAARLAELDRARMAPFTFDNPLELVLISRDLVADLPAMQQFRNAWRGRATLAAVETRFSDGVDFAETIALNDRLLSEAGLSLPIFYELPFDARWDARLGDVVTALADFTTQYLQYRPGFKLRCGGEHVDHVPSPLQVARAINLCRDGGVTLKCTAGLHQPFRHYDATLQLWAHGFVNVFAGGVLAAVHRLDNSVLSDIIADDNPASFTFDGERLAWNDLAAGADQIAYQRDRFLLGFGSCSFDEPLEAVTVAGWLADPTAAVDEEA